ncbi:MAG: S1C family serine protease [Mariniblastus sp.]
MLKAKNLLLVVAISLTVNAFPAPVEAQLSQDVRDVFEGMVPDLDSDLQEKFRKAIRKDTATVEFTPDQFKRFRSNPANPFEGLDRIKVDDSGSNIALKFELPSMRNRQINRHERQSDIVLAQINQPVRSTVVSTVRILAKDRHVAMGTIVKTDGYILTKASEVENRTEIKVELNDGRRFDAKVLRTENNNDLAILKIEADGLSVVNWSDKKVLVGSFLLTPDVDGSVVALGTYSVQPRSTKAGEQAFLGVKPETTTKGVRVSDINSGSASYNAGLRDGDVLTKLGDVVITDVASLVKTIRDRRPGDKVAIEFLRNGKPAIANATLAGRDVSGEQAARFKMMNRLGAVPSRRDDNFPTVFQHDAPLFPEQCGGPITDLDGNVLGINIARKGRAATYAIPSSHVKTVLAGLLRDNVASR